MDYGEAYEVPEKGANEEIPWIKVSKSRRLGWYPGAAAHHGKESSSLDFSRYVGCDEVQFGRVHFSVRPMSDIPIKPRRSSSVGETSLALAL